MLCPDVTVGQVAIASGHRQTAVAQGFLQAKGVAAVPEIKDGFSTAEGMGAGSGIYPGSPAVIANKLLDPVFDEGPPVPGQKEMLLLAVEPVCHLVFE